MIRNPSTAIKRWLSDIPLSLLALTLLACIWMWPLLAGQMPVTADHTVHLARAQAYCDLLAQGKLRGFSQMWGFGVPLGELYPVLGDLGYCGAKALGASHQRAYAWVFALAMMIGVHSQYWLGKSLVPREQRYLSAGVGVIAALLWALDLGAYREGGWHYTVLFGVWPQSLATSLVWLALVALLRAMDKPRRWRPAALLIAASLLAHPMALLHLGIMGVLFALTQKSKASGARFFWCLGIGAGLSAWWWVPMLLSKGMMANYGWLYHSTPTMLKALAKGQWTQYMPSFVGYAAFAGIVLALVGQQRWTKVVAAGALVLWLATSRSLFDLFHFELWGSAWTHLQYQRFLISAKPALYALAGLGLCVPWLLIRRGLQRPRQRQALALSLLGALGYAGIVFHNASSDFKAFQTQAEVLDWGQWPQHRLGERYPEFDSDYAEFVSWAKQAHDSGARWRIHAKDGRNLHWFMDLVPLTGHQLYKSGFTPGDNFRLKPESRDPLILSQLAITHELTRVRSDTPKKAGTRRWGQIQLRPLTPNADGWDLWLKDRLGHASSHPASLQKIDEERWHLELEQDQSHAWPLTVSLPVAYHPRWKIRYLDQTLPAFAAPALGKNAGIRPEPSRTPPGRALGHNGHQPLRLSFLAPGPGSYEIDYQSSNWLDRLGLWVSLLCAIALLTPTVPALFLIPLHKLAALALGGLGIVLSIKIALAVQARSENWTELYAAPLRESHRVAPGLIKSNMVIERALIARPKKGSPASLKLVMESWPDTLELWWSLDDDWAQQRPKPAPNYEIRLWVGRDRKGPPTISKRFEHRSNRHTLILDTASMTTDDPVIWVEMHSDRKRSTRIAFDASPREEPR